MSPEHVDWYALHDLLVGVAWIRCWLGRHHLKIKQNRTSPTTLMNGNENTYILEWWWCICVCYGWPVLCDMHIWNARRTPKKRYEIMQKQACLKMCAHRNGQQRTKKKKNKNNNNRRFVYWISLHAVVCELHNIWSVASFAIEMLYLRSTSTQHSYAVSMLFARCALHVHVM